MPPVNDPKVMEQLRSVLQNWRVTGYVTAKDLVLEWIAKELGGLTLKDVAEIMHTFVKRGGQVDQVPERRPEWSEWPFHYDFRVEIGKREVYIETILQDDDPSDPTLHIVSMHNV